MNQFNYVNKISGSWDIFSLTNMLGFGDL